MTTLYADPEHRPPAREEVQVGLGVLDHWHVPVLATEVIGTSSHGNTVLGPGDAGVAVFLQRLTRAQVTATPRAQPGGPAVTHRVVSRLGRGPFC